MQLDLPVIVGRADPDPVCGDGWHGNTGSEERNGRTTSAKRKASPLTHGKSNWDAFSLRPHGTKKATLSEIPVPPPIPAPSKLPTSLENESTWKPGSGAGAAQQKKVVMGDGAEWIWNLADLHFPGAVQIVDLYHARQHLGDLARRLHPNDLPNQKVWMKVHQKRLLDKGKIENLVQALRAIESPNAELVEKLRTEADYFERNAERMRYPKFRRQHLFVGSGVIEAGCKTVIGSRLKQSGMFWTVRGANAIIALRCCHLNGRFEDYWERRQAA